MKGKRLEFFRTQKINDKNITVEQGSKMCGLKFVTFRQIIYRDTCMPTHKVMKKILKVFPNFPIVCIDLTTEK